MRRWWALRSLDDYRLWLEKHGNGEELNADEVVRKILWVHNWEFCPIELYPHYVLELGRPERGSMEFDLVMKVELEKGVRYVAVEFKVRNIHAVLFQAKERLPFVNYAYGVDSTRGVYVWLKEIWQAHELGIGFVHNPGEGDPLVIAKARYTPIDDDALVQAFRQSLIFNYVESHGEVSERSGERGDDGKGEAQDP